MEDSLEKIEREMECARTSEWKNETSEAEMLGVAFPHQLEDWINRLRALRERDQAFIEAAQKTCDYFDRFGAWHLLSTLGVSEELRAAYRARREGMKHPD